MAILYKALFFLHVYTENLFFISNCLNSQEKTELNWDYPNYATHLEIDHEKYTPEVLTRFIA